MSYELKFAKFSTFNHKYLIKAQPIPSNISLCSTKSRVQRIKVENNIIIIIGISSTTHFKLQCSLPAYLRQAIHSQAKYFSLNPLLSSSLTLLHPSVHSLIHYMDFYSTYSSLPGLLDVQIPLLITKICKSLRCHRCRQNFAKYLIRPANSPKSHLAIISTSLSL